LIRTINVITSMVGFGGEVIARPRSIELGRRQVLHEQRFFSAQKARPEPPRTGSTGPLKPLKMLQQTATTSRRMSLQVISGNTSFGASSRPSEKKKKNGQGRRKGRRVSMMPRVNARSGSRSSVGRTSQGRQSLGRQSVGRQSVGRQSVGRQSAGRQSMGR
jgi:hypothetical protein